jgi:hypothetical protein
MSKTPQEIAVLEHNLAAAEQEIARLRDALNDIAKYGDWDWEAVRDPHKWCREFIYRAEQALNQVKRAPVVALPIPHRSGHA